MEFMLSQLIYTEAEKKFVDDAWAVSLRCLASLGPSDGKDTLKKARDYHLRQIVPGTTPFAATAAVHYTLLAFEQIINQKKGFTLLEVARMPEWRWSVILMAERAVDLHNHCGRENVKQVFHEMQAALSELPAILDSAYKRWEDEHKRHAQA